MTTTAHTPGPWQCNPANGHVSTASEPSLHLGIVHAPEALGRDRFDARAANARLIAAVPDLLRTLELILGSLEFEQHMYGNADPRRSTVDFPRAIEMARAAIAKATGGAA